MSIGFIHKNLRMYLLCFIVCCITLFTVEAVTSHELAMFEQLQKKWKIEGQALLDQRSTIPATNPQYTELTKKIVKAQYWEDYYKEAKIDKSSWWNIIANTVVWSMQDLSETALIMWESSENLLEKMYSANWSGLLKDAVDSLMRQKIRTLIRETFGGEYRIIEDHIIQNFILPKIESSKTQEYAQEAFGKVKEGLKDAYVEEVKRQAATLSKDKLKSYGETIAKRVGGAVDAAEFTIDMVQKYVLWDEAQGTIENMLSAIQNIQSREQCSVIKAFNIYLGKEEMTQKPVETTVKQENKPPTNLSSPAPVVIETISKDRETEPLWKVPAEERFASRTAEQVFADYGVHDGWRVEKTFLGEFHYDEKNSPRFQIKRWPDSSDYANQVMYIKGVNDHNYFVFTYEIAGKTYPSPAGMMMEETYGDIQRSWYPNGQIKEYKRFVSYSCVEHLRWDQMGNPISQ